MILMATIGMIITKISTKLILYIHLFFNSIIIYYFFNIITSYLLIFNNI
jgi:hypothetical protein